MGWFGLGRRGGRHAVRPAVSDVPSLSAVTIVPGPSALPVQAPVVEAPIVEAPIVEAEWLAHEPASAPAPTPAEEAVAAFTPPVKRVVAKSTAVVVDVAQPAVADQLAPARAAGLARSPAAEPAPQPGLVHPRVGLFFGDGSHVVLDDSDPRAEAFTALAQRLNN